MNDHSAAVVPALKPSDEVGKHSARRRSHEPLLGLPLVGAFELGQELRLAAGQRRDRQAVPVDDAIGGQRREPLPGRQDADQIERIGAATATPIRRTPAGGESRAAVRPRREARIARRRSRRRSGRREFPLAPRAGGRRATGPATAAAIRAPASEGARRRRRNGSSSVRAAYSIAASRASSPPSAARARLIIAQRPPLSMSKAQHPPAPPRAGERLALARRHEQSAQAREAVGGREPERDEFAERLLELRAQQTRGFRQLVKEQARRARSRQSSTAWARPLSGAAPLGGASAIQSGARRRSMRAIGVAPTGDDMARAAIRGGGRRQTRPGRPPGQALGVEPRGLVALEPRRQDLGLPRLRRRLEAFERAQDRGERVGPLEARLLRHMLPGEQEAEEVPRGDRIDLRPQPPHRVMMDARQQATVAPLLVVDARKEAAL